jgi:hypothetical protein
MTPVRAVPLGFLAGAVSGIFFLGTAEGGLGGGILGWMTPLPLFLAGLGLGVPVLLIALGAGLTLVAGVVGPTESLLAYGALAVPTLVLVPIEVASRHPIRGTRLVLALTGVGVIGFTGLIAYGALGTGVEPLLRALAEASVKAMVAMMPPGGPEADALGQSVVYYALGSVVTQALTQLAVNGVLAQGALARFGWALKPAPNLGQLALPRGISLPFLASLAVAIGAAGGLGGMPAWIGLIAANLAVVLTVPLVFEGLALLHFVAARRRAGSVVLVGTYVCLILIWPVVGLMGMMDEWVGLRQRIAGAPRQGDE